MTLAEFLDLPGTLTSEQRAQIVDQSILLIESVYAHLPLKKALFAQEPERRLRVLKAEMGLMSELSFHYALLDIFIDLRDLHTRYTLPAPYQTKAAYLPFTLQEYIEDGQPHFLVAELLEDIDDPQFTVGVELLQWNGVPIAWQVEALMRTTFGSNRASMRARAIQLMSLRHLAYAFAPTAASATISYRTADGQTGEITLGWKIVEAMIAKNLFDHPKEDIATVINAVDSELTALTALRHALRQRHAEQQPASRSLPMLAVSAAPPIESTLPNNFSAHAVTSEQGEFGYIRIATFENTQSWPPLGATEFIQRFVAEFRRLLTLVPQRGLILDLRGNSGGILPAGESLLQLFAPQPIDPALYQFRNTEATLALVKNAPASYALASWLPSIESGLRNGSEFSQALPFMPFCTGYNDIGQSYYGPVVLLINALCYSTTDMFIAAFIDNQLGKVIGVDDNSGAGGANMWNASAVASILEQAAHKDVQPLPAGASLTLAVRRAVRVREYAGQPIEDIGIVPDCIHQRTKDDLLHADRDLFNLAGKTLAAQPVYGLRCQLQTGDTGVQLTVDTSNLSRLDIYIDNRPVKTLDISDGQQQISDLSLPAGAQRIEVLGFKDAQLAACARLPLSAPPAAAPSTPPSAPPAA